MENRIVCGIRRLQLTQLPDRLGRFRLVYMFIDCVEYVGASQLIGILSVLEMVYDRSILYNPFVIHCTLLLRLIIYMKNNRLH